MTGGAGTRACSSLITDVRLRACLPRNNACNKRAALPLRRCRCLFGLGIVFTTGILPTVSRPSVAAVIMQGAGALCAAAAAGDGAGTGIATTAVLVSRGVMLFAQCSLIATVRLRALLPLNKA